jgi:hypothetical protein
MWTHRTISCRWLLVIGPSLVGLVVLAQEPQPVNRSATVNLSQLLPHWQPGDQWVVETTSLLLQTRGAVQPVRSRPIQWQFTVQRYEKVIDDDCFRVEIRCLLPGPPQPATVLWVDKKTHVLRQITTQIPIPGGFTTLTENYEFPSGQPSPVLGPLTALPLDFPLFHGGEAKGLEKFSYEASVGPAGTKALGDLGFSFDVQQDVQVAPAEQVKGLLSDEFTKDLETHPAIEVKLQKFDRKVRQVWQAGLPWPAYSEDAQTKCKLVKVTTKAESNQ